MIVGVNPGQNRYKVSVHRAPHLLCYRALEVQQIRLRTGALHLRHPINAYSSAFYSTSVVPTP